MHRQKVDSQLPGLRGGKEGERLFNGYRVLFWGDEKALGLEVAVAQY